MAADEQLRLRIDVLVPFPVSPFPITPCLFQKSDLGHLASTVTCQGLPTAAFPSFSPSSVLASSVWVGFILLLLVMPVCPFRLHLPATTASPNPILLLPYCFPRSFRPLRSGWPSATLVAVHLHSVGGFYNINSSPEISIPVGLQALPPFVMACPQWHQAPVAPLVAPTNDGQFADAEDEDDDDLTLLTLRHVLRFRVLRVCVCAWR